MRATLDIGRGFVTPPLHYDTMTATVRFLCPRYRAVVCDIPVYWIPVVMFAFVFLCPRYRAVVCDLTPAEVAEIFRVCFYALDIGRWFVTT